MEDREDLVGKRVRLIDMPSDSKFIEADNRFGNILNLNDIYITKSESVNPFIRVSDVKVLNKVRALGAERCKDLDISQNYFDRKLYLSYKYGCVFVRRDDNGCICDMVLVSLKPLLLVSSKDDLQYALCEGSNEDFKDIYGLELCIDVVTTLDGTVEMMEQAQGLDYEGALQSRSYFCEFITDMESTVLSEGNFVLCSVNCLNGDRGALMYLHSMQHTYTMDNSINRYKNLLSLKAIFCNNSPYVLSNEDYVGAVDSLSLKRGYQLLRSLFKTNKKFCEFLSEWGISLEDIKYAGDFIDSWDMFGWL